MLVAAIIALLLVLLAAGVPIAFALLVAGGVGLIALRGWALFAGIVQTTPFSAIDNFEFITIPMFILMAHFLVKSGISDNLFSAATVWLGRVRGGLAIATAVSGAAFGAISGSSTAAAATLSSTSVPAMVKHGYDKRLACGVASIAGTLAILIPPSVGIIFYGLLSETSISKLLIAGLLPGLLVAIAIIVTTLTLVIIRPELAPQNRRYTWMEKLIALKVLGPFLILFGFVTGSIYAGIATPVEASALGAFGAMAFAVYLRRLSFRDFFEALFATARTTAMIALVVICAQVFSYFMALTQTTQTLITAVGDSGLPSWLIVTILIAIYIALGCFLDMISILVLTIPVVLPIITSLGIDPIWFGIIVILTAEVGLVTPPVGLNVFVVAKYAEVPVADVFRGVAPFVLVHIFIIALLCIFPGVITWLPRLMAR